MDKETIEIRELFCEWCQKDCQKFTAEERLGCLASGGFVKEFKSLGYIQQRCSICGKELCGFCVNCQEKYMQALKGEQVYYSPTTWPFYSI